MFSRTFEAVLKGVDSQRWVLRLGREGVFLAMLEMTLGGGIRREGNGHFLILQNRAHLSLVSPMGLAYQPDCRCISSNK